jgi:tRNA(Leu) C34 or U34 (ribose-2'-O)-methylase TrmL
VSLTPRGYFGIAVYRPKCAENIGTLWRSAHAFGAAFIATVGHRYRRQPGDTTYAAKHVPLYQFADWPQFVATLPEGAELVCIEQTDASRKIRSYSHPARAVYVLGAEDTGIPAELLRGHQVVHIDTPRCANSSGGEARPPHDRPPLAVLLSPLALRAWLDPRARSASVV